ncbi:MAG: OmpA family protein [Akkermansiaceae bacterium]|jgi:outer membrane protein OmpA-like peptidoglycan-associated protein
METNDTNDTNTPSQAPTESTTNNAVPTSNKNGGNQLTTALIVIIVVLLFVMLMLSMNGKLFQSDGGNNADIAALTAKNAQLRADANAERARQGLPPLPEDSSSARMTADRLKRDATALASLAGQWQTELETKDAALRDLQSQLTSRDENAKRLYAQISALQTKLDQAANSTNQVARLGNDLQMANNQIENYRKQLAELQGQLADFRTRPSTEDTAILRKQLNDSVENRNKLQMQIDGLLEAAKNKIDRSQYDEAMAEIAKLRPQVNLQRYEIQRLRSLLDRARLFIESEKDLPAEAARLYARLKTLDNVSGPALTPAYKEIETTLGARVIHRQTFATGSSQITFNRETMIKNAMGKGAGSTSYFLVVGYASKTGGAKANQTLSAARATTAASVVNLLKTPQQDVRAVYLGQTDRFDKTNHISNQICEVWEIKR